MKMFKKFIITDCLNSPTALIIFRLENNTQFQEILNFHRIKQPQFFYSFLSLIQFYSSKIYVFNNF